MEDFLLSDGSPDFRAIIRASDDRLRRALRKAKPETVKIWLAQVKAFEPSLSQKSGAALLGISIAAQKVRIIGLLEERLQAR